MQQLLNLLHLHCPTQKQVYHDCLLGKGLHLMLIPLGYCILITLVFLKSILAVQQHNSGGIMGKIIGNENFF